MIEKLSVAVKASPEKVLDFFGGEYAEHFKELSADHIKRVVTIKNPDLDHPDVSFSFTQYSPITGQRKQSRAR